MFAFVLRFGRLQHEILCLVASANFSPLIFLESASVIVLPLLLSFIFSMIS